MITNDACCFGSNRCVIVSIRQEWESSVLMLHWGASLTQIPMHRDLRYKCFGHILTCIQGILSTGRICGSSVLILHLGVSLTQITMHCDVPYECLEHILVREACMWENGWIFRETLRGVSEFLWKFIHFGDYRPPWVNMHSRNTLSRKYLWTISVNAALRCVISTDTHPPWSPT